MDTPTIQTPSYPDRYFRDIYSAVGIATFLTITLLSMFFGMPVFSH